MAFRTVVFQGSVRDGRMGERVVNMVVAELKKRKHEVTVFDPLELENKGVPLLKKPLHWYQDPSEAPQILKEMNTSIQESDALVFVTAEYNCACPPALLNLIDHFSPASYAFKPSSIVSYSMGPFGGIRAAASLRNVLSEVGAITSQSACVIPTVQNAVKEDGQPDERVGKNLVKSMDYLEWYADAIRMKKDKSGLPNSK